jgi:hypothetical protein
MRPSLVRTVLAGTIGTLALTFVFYGLSPLITGQALDIAQLLSVVLNRTWPSALLAHILIGILVLPVGYAYLFSPRVPITPWVRGICWGIILWLLSELLLVPMAGGRIFHHQAGGLPFVLLSLGAHLLYGLSLGLFAVPVPESRGPSRFDAPQS